MNVRWSVGRFLVRYAIRDMLRSISRAMIPIAILAGFLGLTKRELGIPLVMLGAMSWIFGALSGGMVAARHRLLGTQVFYEYLPISRFEFAAFRVVAMITVAALMSVLSFVLLFLASEAQGVRVEPVVLGLVLPALFALAASISIIVTPLLARVAPATAAVAIVAVGIIVSRLWPRVSPLLPSIDAKRLGDQLMTSRLAGTALAIVVWALLYAAFTVGMVFLGKAFQPRRNPSRLALSAIEGRARSEVKAAGAVTG